MKSMRPKGGEKMEKQENAIIACEVKVGLTAKSWNEIQDILCKIRKACDFDHKLEINFEGSFFKSDTSFTKCRE